MVDRKKTKYRSKQKRIPKINFPKIRRKTKLKSVQEARIAVKQLEQDYTEAKTRRERRIIKRKLIFASNKANKKARKRRLAKEKKLEYMRVADVYEEAYQKMLLDEIWENIEKPAIPELEMSSVKKSKTIPKKKQKSKTVFKPYKADILLKEAKKADRAYIHAIANEKMSMDRKHVYFRKFVKAVNDYEQYSSKKYLDFQ